MKFLILLAASVTTMGSFVAVSESPPPASRIVTKTADGKPILLARMVVTATPLED